jgi:uncharacterized coiled-coil protein SlyX
MTERHNTSAGFAGLIQLWTSQLRQITEGLADTTGLSDSVLPQPGALSAAQLNLIASSVAAQRQSIAAMQAQLRAFDEQLAMLQEILGPLTESGTTDGHRPC